MFKFVRYKINRLPCQIYFRFVFASVLYLSFCLFFFPVCLIVFLLLTSFTRDVWQPLTQIRLSLSVALGARQITFLAGINATENTVRAVFIYSWFFCHLGT